MAHEVMPWLVMLWVEARLDVGMLVLGLVWMGGVGIGKGLLLGRGVRVCWRTLLAMRGCDTPAFDRCSPEYLEGCVMSVRYHSRCS